MVTFLSDCPKKFVDFWIVLGKRNGESVDSIAGGRRITILTDNCKDFYPLFQ